MIYRYFKEYLFDLEGNFLISYSYGNYGFIQHERMDKQPLFLLDTGIERRNDETYYFDNNNRPAYGGYLLQYTLKGNGIFEKNGKKHVLREGFGFFSKIPENSLYFFSKDISATNNDISGSNGINSDNIIPSNITNNITNNLTNNTTNNISFTNNIHLKQSYIPKQEWEFFYLHFDGAAAESFYDTINKLTNGVFYISPDKAPVHLFFRLIDNYKRKGFLELYEGGEFLYRFLSGILREIEAPTDSVSPTVSSATAFMRKNFATIDSITDVSDFCHISPEHLSRCFKKEKGQSPLQFLTKLRIEHALFLLLNTNDTIESIALSCGFMNGNYFAKIFKKYLQCSPTEYRLRNSS